MGQLLVQLRRLMILAIAPVIVPELTFQEIIAKPLKIAQMVQMINHVKIKEIQWELVIIAPVSVLMDLVEPIVRKL